MLVSAWSAIESSAVSPAFSRRSGFAREPNRWALARDAALRAGTALLDLTESNPTRAALPLASAAVSALAHPGAVHYDPEPLGLHATRALLSKLSAQDGLPVAPERIVLTASTSEAYAFLFKLLCDAGDEVLVPAPSYPLFDHLAQLEGVCVRRYPLVYDGRWHLDADALRAARGPRTRAVVAVHPNNPTGSYLKHDELDALAQLGLPIISDEVFAAYPQGEDGRRAKGARAAADALVFTLGGLSKLAALPQFKLAWTLVTGQATQVADACARLELIADSYLSVSTPVQLALPEILQAQRPVRDAIRARLACNLSATRARLQGSAASALHVEGGFYAVVRLPEVLDDEAWALELLRSDAVLVQPGYLYDFGRGAFVVLSLLTEEAVFAEGMARLASRVAAICAGAKTDQ